VLVLPLWQRALPWALTGALAAGLAAMLVLWAPWRPAAALPHVTRTTITTSGSAALTIDRLGRDLAVSPDGTHVAYIGNGSTQLFVRALDALEPVAIATATTLRGPFFSPDGQWVGFLDGVVGLTKVAITGGAPIPIARLNNGARGATWAQTRDHYFRNHWQTTGLQRVGRGRHARVLTGPTTRRRSWPLRPEILPGGRAVLFTITSQSQTGGIETNQVAVRDLRTGAQKVLLRGGVMGTMRRAATWSRCGRNAARDCLRSDRLETRGTSVPVNSAARHKGLRHGRFRRRHRRTLAYVDGPGSLAANARTLVWLDRSGKEEPLAAPPRAYVQPRVSPDGTRVAVSSLDQEKDLWIWDIARAKPTRLTLDPGQDWHPVWTPDSQRIVFSSDRGGGHFNLWWQAADGTGDAERLTTNSNVQFATGITRDGTAALFFEVTPTMGRDLMQLALASTPRKAPLVQTRFDERKGSSRLMAGGWRTQSNSSESVQRSTVGLPNVSGAASGGLDRGEAAALVEKRQGHSMSARTAR
jgi:serine/threonine-protein kinase